MRAVVRSRASGKTDEMIRLSADQGGYIVVTNGDAHRVSKRAEELGLRINFPLTFQEFIKGQLHGPRCSPLWFDNADMLLAQMAQHRGAEIGGWSATSEESKTTETMGEQNVRLRQMVNSATDRLAELDATIVRLRKLIG